MGSVISTGGQTRVKNSYASSADAKLTLRVNGEENAVVITPQMGVVPAGFNAPTVAPTIGTNGAGNVPVGFYVYRYVYASSRYPNVQNAVTGGGEQWPRSNPSPPSATYQVTPAAESNAVTVTYSTRSDVDWIWVYRTSVQTTAALAEAQDDAGELFYVGRIANNTAGGTGVFTDNEAAENANEEMEADNFACPLSRFTVFDGKYFWTFGNTVLEVVVILDGTDTFIINTTDSDVDEWFSGRNTEADGFNGAEGPNSNSISFVGITTGGYDGRGNYYFKIVTNSSGQAFNAATVSTPVTLQATGSTTAYLTAPLCTLYRSKPNNPFSWGWTQSIISQGNEIEVPQLWAEQIGGGTGTAISLIPNERILKLDTEGPTKSYALDLNAAGEDTEAFLGTLRTLDEAQSVSSHFSQFPMRLAQGQSVGTGINAKAIQILSADAQSQIPIGTPVIRTLRKIQPDGTQADFFHGVFDFRTELNCWFVKSTVGDPLCDTMLYQHAPTGTWGQCYTPGITASAMIFDYVTRQNMTFVGTDDGLLGRAFASGIYRNWLVPDRVGAEIIHTGSGSVTVSTPVVVEVITTIATGTHEAQVITDGPHGLSVNDMIAMGTAGTPNIFRVKEVNGVDGFLINTVLPHTSGDILALGTYIWEPVHMTWGVWYSATRAYVGRFDNFSTQLVALGRVAGTADIVTVIDIQSGDEVEPANVPSATYSLYAGATPAVLRRYYNGGNPEMSKRKIETWATILRVDSATDKRYVAYYPEYQTAQSSQTRATLTNDEISSGVASTVYYDKLPPVPLVRSFGHELYECGYDAVEFTDITMKAKDA